MKPERTFVAERAAAQHCPELMRRAPGPAELLPRFAQLGERCARLLSPALARLLGGEPPVIAVQNPREASEGELAAEIGALAANTLLATGVPGVAVLAAIDGAAMLRLVDRAFGGKGEAPVKLPEEFPLSAELMIAKLETLFAQSLGAALGQAGTGTVSALRRSTNLAELAPFPAGARLAVLRCEVREPNAAPWLFTLALPLALLGRLLGSSTRGAPLQPRSGDPAAVPFAELPLPVRAVLVDMPIALSTLAALAPGLVLPITVARAAALRIGASTIARGTIGAQDECIAIRITQLA